jgi:hypothetical protein
MAGLIAKVQTRGGTRFSGFAKIVAYVERLEAAVETRYGTQLNPREPIAPQMDAAYARGTGRVRNPVYHYVLSWEARDLDRARVWSQAQESLEVLGAQRLQWIGVLQGDTAHWHIHMVVNRVDPQSGRAWTPSYDHGKLQAFARRVEPGRPEHAATDRIAPRAADFEAWTGQQSMQSWARERLLPELREILRRPRPRWRSFHLAIMERHGITYDPKTALFVDETGRRPNDRVRRQTLRATAVAPELAHVRLEERLGPYEAPPLGITPRVDVGYGAARDAWALRTKAMRDPLVAPLYDRFVAEQRDWVAWRRHAAKTDRLARAARTKRLAEQRHDELALALTTIARGTRSRSQRDVAVAALRRLERENDRDERKRAHRDANARPTDLFRRWLKERAINGDAAAGVAILAIRKHKTQALIDDQSLIQQREARTVATLSDLSLGETTVDRLRRALRVAKREENADLEIASEYRDDIGEAIEQIGSDAQTIARYDYLVAQLRDGGGPLPEVASGAALAVVSSGVLSDEVRERLYRPIEPFAPLAEFELPYVAERTIRAGIATETSSARKLSDIERPFRTDGPIEGIDFQDGVFVRYQRLETADGNEIFTYRGTYETSAALEELRGKLEANTRRTTARRDSQPTAETSDLEDAPEVSGIGRPDHERTKTLHPYFASLEEQEAANTRLLADYEHYVATVGRGAFQFQHDLYTERKDVILRDLKNALADAKLLEGKERHVARSLAFARAVKLQASLEDSYQREEAILANALGDRPPLSYRAYLKGLGPENREASALSEIVDERRDAASIYTRPRFTESATLAKSLEWKEHVTGTIVYRIAGKRAFVDSGTTLIVENWKKNEAGLRVALQIADLKFGSNGISLIGSDAYKRATLALAVELGIEVTNPELQREQERLQHELRGREDARRALTPTQPTRAGAESVHEILRNPDLDRAEKDQRIEAIILKEATSTLLRDKPAVKNVTVASAAEAQAGFLEEVLVFNKRAYAVIARVDDLTLTKINRENAQELATHIGAEVHAKPKEHNAEFSVLPIRDAARARAERSR